MGRRVLPVGVVGLSLAATASIAATRADVPLRLGCPSKGERVGIVGASFNDVVTAARRVLYREITHYQGTRERRTATNTPVVAAVMDLGYLTPARLPGQRQLLVRATRICGRHVARFSSAVMFHDGLDIVCCLPPITLFVVRSDRSLRVYPWPHPLTGRQGTFANTGAAERVVPGGTSRS
jgi:hypothetical protein